MQGLPTNEITSSITFSVILYFNVYFSFVFFVGNAALITEKLLHFRFESNLQEVLLLPCFIIWIVGEVSRFYFGYTGNLKERVPQMSAFLLITIFPQLPCVIFFAYFQEVSERSGGGLLEDEHTSHNKLKLCSILWLARRS